jgi:hypothetical protein
MEATVCTSCHNDRSPTLDKDKPFDFARDKDSDRHEQVELKQREN